MTDQQLTNGFLAVLIGTAVAVALVVPTAAVLYRRQGSMSVGSLLVLLSAGVYGVALWSYTLLPLPASMDYTCVRPLLEPGYSFRLLRANGVRTPGLLAANPYFWQTVLNVALFVPFGYFVRRVLGGGFLVAGLLGFGVSLLIESTQLTGVWGLFPCAYRYFEVDDLITNTSGAVIGSILSIALAGTTNRARQEWREGWSHPDHVTVGRRWMGLVCDLLWTVGTSVVVTVAFRAWHTYGPGTESALGGRMEAWLGWTVAAALQALVVVAAGRTLGEWTVALRTEALTPTNPGLLVLQRLVKFGVGIGAFVLLSVWDGGPSWALPAFLAVTVLGTLPGGHSGLSNRVAGLRLRV